MNSLTEGRNYIHKLQMVHRGGDSVTDSQLSTVKSPVMQSFSAQLSSLPSMDDVSELSATSGGSGGNNKISRNHCLILAHLLLWREKYVYVCVCMYVCM